MAHPIVHFEIPAEDLERLKQFYSELLGWKFETAPGMPNYMMVTTAEKGEGMGINGGLMKKMMPQQTVINYALVESVAEYSDKVKQLGGQVVVSKTAVPKMGYFAVCLDPEGNPIGLWELAENAA
jgi:predicted enzyme related to lactoylglutathione lyase